VRNIRACDIDRVDLIGGEKRSLIVKTAADALLLCIRRAARKISRIHCGDFATLAHLRGFADPIAHKTRSDDSDAQGVRHIVCSASSSKFFFIIVRAAVRKVNPLLASEVYLLSFVSIYIYFFRVFV